MNKIRLSSVHLIILIAVFIIIANNQVLWVRLSERLDLFSLQGLGFTLTYLLYLSGSLALVFLLFGQKYTLKALLVLFVMVASITSYFSQQLGVIFNEDMIRNIAETIRDNNHQEAFELVSTPLVLHVLLFGVLPSVFIVMAKVTYKTAGKELLTRSTYAVGILLVLAAMIMLNFKYVAYFTRENRDLRVYVTPEYPIKSSLKFFRGRLVTKEDTYKRIGEDAKQVKISPKRTVGIMVIGETARADHFSLNGYNKQTNPRLNKLNIINYTNAYSCGTSTAYSVPCMFSFFNRDEYTPDKAGSISNVLDVLETSGVKVIWIDNNSSCKGVCRRIDNINLRDNLVKNSPFYNRGEYFDEALLDHLDKHINNTKSDILIVLHTLGSHGPKYFKRFPDTFAAFKPYCTRSAPQECDASEIVNAYDNTILYTDYILSKTIKYLKENNSNYNSFMVYFSDHGESLGEDGIYLHGLPYFLAPEAQTHVPLIVWFSDYFADDNNIDITELQYKREKEYSHDNLSYSLLGLFNVKTSLYDRELDIFHTHKKLGLSDSTSHGS
ncbi:MAG: phosphoethanolamine--lipid A transferase [Gammaproteobacteria bacterium]|nr:MAG: phosphoethanolamine--lipid A transferase [Gammaproteobacteria bacterium]